MVIVKNQAEKEVASNIFNWQSLNVYLVRKKLMYVNQKLTEYYTFKLFG